MNVLITIGSIILSLSVTAFAVLFGTIDQHLPSLHTFCLLFGIIGLIFGGGFIASGKANNQVLDKKVKIACILTPVIATVLMFSSCMGMDLSPSSSVDTSSSSNSSRHECYVCGKSASHKYGSFYYCATHYAMVKTVVEAD